MASWHGKGSVHPSGLTRKQRRAIARGVRYTWIGRPEEPGTEPALPRARHLNAPTDVGTVALASVLGVSRRTVWRNLGRLGALRRGKDWRIPLTRLMTRLR